MSVQFYLLSISLTDDENDYRAVTVSVGTITEEELINRIAVRNTSVPVQMIIGWMQLNKL